MDLIIEGISWNREYFVQQVAGGLSENEFVCQSLMDGQYKGYSEIDRVALLKMVYGELKKGAV